MKFLCVPCDSPMNMRSTEESEPGSLAVVYSCPQCGYEMAMLTNPSETQFVRSLGVRIGPPNTAGGTAAAATAIAAPEVAGGAGEAAGGSRCPFSAMVGSVASDALASAVPPAVLGAVPPAVLGAVPPAVLGGPTWTPEALARLEAIPEMVRPMARAGIEMVAREKGQLLIDEALLSEARTRFGM